MYQVHIRNTFLDNKKVFVNKERKYFAQLRQIHQYTATATLFRTTCVTYKLTIKINSV